MTDANIENPEEEKSTPEAVDIFKDMSAIEPPRDEELEDDDLEENEDGHGTLEERIEGSRKLTDFQTLSKVLNPVFKVDYLNLVSKGRTFPDNYNDMADVFVKDLIKMGYPVPEALANVNTALSKSIDGESTIDNIVAYTRGNKEATTEQNKGVGLQ